MMLNENAAVPSGSAWDDKDYLLEYKTFDLKTIVTSDILDVPVHNAGRDEAVALILDLIEKKTGPHHVLLLDPVKLMRVRPGKKYHSIARDARYVFADGAGLEWAASKLGNPLKDRIPMISLIMDLIRVAWKTDLTIYFLGSKSENLDKIYTNLSRVYPGLRIIGRQSGFFSKERELLIKESIRKSSPDIIFIGMGFPLQEKWLRDNWEDLAKAVVIGIDGSFDILSGTNRKAPDKIQLSGSAWLWRTFTRPYLLGRLFRVFQFYIMTVFRSIKNKRKVTE
jgi:N-acetylglucosaminyldiphosphoundecaprenol N-acetyl-beta-D-mannosaminyltransferase